jgi:hypothetical protein
MHGQQNKKKVTDFTVGPSCLVYLRTDGKVRDNPGI